MNCSMTKKYNKKTTYIVTGASHGLGFETVKALAQDPSLIIIMAGHNEFSLIHAMQEIQRGTAKATLLTSHLNLADLSSVRKFAQKIKNAALPPIKGIVCNAGVFKPSPWEKSVEEYEITFAVNHLGHFLLTILLLKKLATPARVMLVSSNVHEAKMAWGKRRPSRYVKADWLAYPETSPLLPESNTIAGAQAYANSKLCNILFAYELSRRLQSAKISAAEKMITVNAFDPGLMVATGLGRDKSGINYLFWYSILPHLARFIPRSRTTAESGGNLAWLMTSPEVATITNSYFVDRTPTASSIESRHLGKSADLWYTSLKLAGVAESEMEWLGKTNISYA